jgi:4-amino-4-deoxy-L-arabinose transferase-like glycosyltransferase
MEASDAHDHGAAQPSIFSNHPYGTGIAIGVATLAPHFFLDAQASLAFAALVVSMVAGVYFGFAVTNGTERNQMVELNIALVFAVAGLLGFLFWPVLIAGAYFAHGAWDLAHHNRARLSLVAIPQWYVPFCIVVDVIVGTGLIAIWIGKDIPLAG